MARVLITRLSSLGDVALLVPVVYSVALKYPQARFTVLTRKAYVPLFEQMSFNVSVVGVDLEKKHSGLWGLIKLIFKVNGFKYTHVADVHNVLRTQILRWSMFFSFTKTAKINKERKEKAAMVKSKVTSPFLDHTTQRYMDVFKKLGFDAPFAFSNIFEFKSRSFDYIKNVVPVKKGKWIGIAPFARHQGKIYPIAKVEELIEKLSHKPDISILLFGGGEHEMKIVESLSAKYPHIIIPFKKMKFKNELILISYLDLMISMDSANMHLASLSQVPVVSLWGATHPALGFYGFNQDIDNVVQVDMSCRPCSVYGDAPCLYTGKDQYKCLKSISVDLIMEKVDKVLEEVSLRI